MLRGLILGAGAITNDALAVQVTLTLNLNVRVARLELGAVLDVPFGHEVVLDPDNLVESLDERRLALDVQTGVRQDGFGHDILNEAQTDTEMDVFDVEGVLSAESNVHHAT